MWTLTLHFPSSALRQWVSRFASQGTQGLVDRPRPGRPRKVTCALAQHLHRLVDQDPLEHGALHSQGSCRELAAVFARETGVLLGRESVRGGLKKSREATIAPPGGLILIPLTSRMVLLHWPPASPRHAGARSLCSLQTQPSCGVLPCPVWAGGAPPRASASRDVP